ncbi:MAG: DUF6265 family protein [Pseudomonadota bacterium]
MLHNKIVASALVALLSLLLTSGAVLAQSQRTEHTYKLDDPEARPAASLDDVAWLTGSWTGTAFGSRFEQVWNAPSAGSMVGLFKLFDDDGVSFYEILLLIPEGDSLALRVKHFTNEFVAWEDKPDYISFPLVRIDDDALHFSGLSFYRVDDNSMDGYLVMKTSDGVVERKLEYARAGR